MSPTKYPTKFQYSQTWHRCNTVLACLAIVSCMYITLFSQLSFLFNTIFPFQCLDSSAYFVLPHPYTKLLSCNLRRTNPSFYFSHQFLDIYLSLSSFMFLHLPIPYQYYLVLVLLVNFHFILKLTD